MNNEKEIFERIKSLEQEVSNLRQEVQLLKQHTNFDQVNINKSKLTPIYTLPIKQKEKTKIEKTKEPISVKSQKEKRSLEETLTRTLRKIFIVILVLGVLWGLKLVSDYGILTDHRKIIGAYILSIGLGICGLVMEKKKKGSPVVTLSLYGGTFIVGILTTAAGAILYDVLNLYVALIIALLYIGYGVAISYLKGNEALTVLVVFTSLLLPYLLEYMDFNWSIIGIFVVLLFTVIQLVILKHKQRISLYIGMSFSILALCIVSLFHTKNMEFFAFALVVLFSVFLISYLFLYQKENKMHAGLLFSFTVITISAINIMLFKKETVLCIALLIMIGILICAAYFVFKRKLTILFDIVITLGILILLNLIAQLNISNDVIVLLLVITTFIALMLAIKHSITFMKWINSITFSILSLFVFIAKDVKPFISIENLTLLIVIAMLFVLYRFLYRRNSNRSKMILSAENIFPILIYVATLIYIWKIDFTYMPSKFYSHLLYSTIVVMFAFILILKQRYVGKLLPFLASIVYIFASLTLFPNMLFHDEKSIAAELALRFIYIGIIWAILVDLWKQGIIYKNYSTILSRANVVQLTIAGFIISILAIFSISNLMYINEIISANIAVVMNTSTIFVISFLSLFLAIKTNERNLQQTGIGLLFFGIIKMIFFDLSELHLLIRSITFIIIGAIGLFASNKLLVKGKEKSKDE